MAVTATTETTRRRLRGLLAFVVVAGFVARGRIDDLLRALHGPDAPSFGMGDASLTAVATWRAAAQQVSEVGRFASEEQITAVYLVAHALVVAGLPLLLALLVPAPERWAGDRGLPDLRWFLRRTPPVAAAAATVGALQVLALALGTQLGSPPGEAFTAATVLGYAHLILIGLLLLAVVVPRLIHVVSGRGEPGRWRDALGAVRLQIVVVALFAGLLHGPIAGEQSADVMLRWVQGSEWVDGAIAVVFTLWLSAVVYGACRGLLLQERVPPQRRLRAKWTLIAAGALAALGGIAALTHQPYGLAVLGGLVFAYGLLGLIQGPPEERRPPPAPPAGLPLAIAAVPLVALGLALQSAAIGELVYASQTRLVWLVALGLALQVAGWALVSDTPRLDGWVSPIARWLSHDVEDGRPQPHAGVLVSAAALALLTVRIWTDPWRISTSIGTVGIFAAFSTALALIAFAVSQADQRRQPPAVLSAPGVHRHPILLGLVAWLTLSFVLGAGRDGYHDARVVAAERTPAAKVSIEQAWARWERDNVAPRLVPRPPEQRGERQAVPLVLVAASGGGVRAAYWTANALDRVFERHPQGWPRVFAISGASGGSVGTAYYTAKVDVGDTDGWVERRLGEDHLAPTWAWTLFADLPQGFGILDAGQDRAAVLERSFEQSWLPRGGLLDDEPPPTDGPDAGPLATKLRARGAALPLLLFNATSVEDGCRIGVSALDAGLEGRSAKVDQCLSLAALERPASDRPPGAALGATEDVVDLLCDDQDLRLSTASTLSARFPFVTPSGRVTDCDDRQRPKFAVDGGYFDNTGAGTLTELWTALGPRVAAFNARSRSRCVVPVFLQLDNTYEEAGPPKAQARPAELAVPAQTALRVIGIGPGREASARQNAGITFGSTTTVTGLEPYARLYPRAHPGTAPPLGWSLSRISMADMDRQLDLDHNAAQLDRVASWFDDGLTCAG